MVFIFLVTALFWSDSAAAPVAAQETGYVIRKSVFLPPTYYVGDPVELRLTLDLPPGKKISPPSELPSSSMVSVRQCSVVQVERSAQIVLRFVSFTPGAGVLPPLDLGEITVRDFRIQTTSILEKEKPQFRGLRSQVLLPGSRLFFGIILGVLFLGPVTVLFSFGRFRRLIIRAVLRLRERRPYRILQRTLKTVIQEMDKETSRGFYIKIMEAFKLYLSRRVTPRIRSATTSEVDSILARELGANRLEISLKELFVFGDRVKFGGERADAGQREEDVTIIRKIAGQIETIYRRKRTGETPDRKSVV